MLHRGGVSTHPFIEYLSKIKVGSMRNFYAARPHFPQKWEENHNFSCQIFSIQKNHLLRPRFLKSPGSEDTIFPYRYFWHTNLQFFARISWKMGSVQKFFLHRPRAVHSPTSGLYVGGSHSCETAIQWIDVKAAHSANLWILKIYWKKVVDFWKKCWQPYGFVVN